MAGRAVLRPRLFIAGAIAVLTALWRLLAAITGARTGSGLPVFRCRPPPSSCTAGGTTAGPGGRPGGAGADHHEVTRACAGAPGRACGRCPAASVSQWSPGDQGVMPPTHNLKYLGCSPRPARRTDRLDRPVPVHLRAGPRCPGRGPARRAPSWSGSPDLARFRHPWRLLPRSVSLRREGDRRSSLPVAPACRCLQDVRRARAAAARNRRPSHAQSRGRGAPGVRPG